jgi:hypothetical protein
MIRYDNSNTNVVVNPDPKKNTKNNFMVSMGSLPTQKVLPVANLKILQASNQYLYFSLEIASTDARQWNDWLRTAARNIKKKMGSLHGWILL